jgi:hypothetical protein
MLRSSSDASQTKLGCIPNKCPRHFSPFSDTLKWDILMVIHAFLNIIIHYDIHLRTQIINSNEEMNEYKFRLSFRT